MYGGRSPSIGPLYDLSHPALTQEITHAPVDVSLKYVVVFDR